jgi:hypothetical protein
MSTSHIQTYSLYTQSYYPRISLERLRKTMKNLSLTSEPPETGIGYLPNIKGFRNKILYEFHFSFI